MKIELIATGSELVNGDIINTNTAFLAQELRQMGFETAYHTIVMDSLNDLLETIQIALKRCGMLIITGGLGPTTDDITKTAVAKVLNLELNIHEPSLARIKDFFKDRNIVMPESNIQQALIPMGGIVLENNLGTAPGIIIEDKAGTIIMLPGPPFEMKQMFIEGVKPYLKAKYDTIIKGKIFEQGIIKLAGIGESKVQDIIRELQIDQQIGISYRADKGEIIVKLFSQEPDGKNKIDNAIRLISGKLKDYIFAYADNTLENVVGEMLLKQKLKIGIAESCTGGLLNHKLTNVPGSSGYLSHGIVSYSKEAKIELLKVCPTTIKEYTPVSKETAKEMARGVKDILNVDIGLSITGYAGGAADTNKIKDTRERVGLVYIGLSTNLGIEAKEFFFTGDRLAVKEMAAKAGLYLLWRYLANINN